MNQKPTTESGVQNILPPAATLKTILIAEDEHLLAKSLAADVAELGYTVVGPARNGQDATDMARTSKPDIALLDIRMPVMDGLTAAQHIFGEMGIPVIIISAYSDANFLKAGVEIGVFGYLLKPVSLDELRVTLTVAWGRYLAQKALAGENDKLKTKLEERKVIERAKGLLMKTGLDEEEAMRMLQKRARDSRRPMVELAKALLDAHEFMEKADKPKK
jgi:response regulator NasT